MAGRAHRIPKLSRRWLRDCATVVTRLNLSQIARFDDAPPPPLWQSARLAALEAHSSLLALAMALHTEFHLPWSTPDEDDTARCDDERSPLEIAHEINRSVFQSTPPARLQRHLAPYWQAASRSVFAAYCALNDIDALRAEAGPLEPMRAKDVAA